MFKILFVCLGNICRSSAAQGVFEKIIQQKGVEKYFSVDSAGLISYHQGELSDPRMIEHAKMRGYNLTHRSRPITQKDFEEFDYIFAMDNDNIKRLSRINAELTAKKVTLLAEYCTEHEAKIIPDPYYGTGKDFDYVLDLLEDSCTNLCNILLQELN